MSDDVVQRLEIRLADLETRLTHLSSDVEDLAALSDAETEADTDERSGAEGSFAPVSEIDFVFPAADAWVRDYLLPTFQRPFGGELRWCDRWYEHPEAAVRLEAMWRAWETLHPDPGLGLSVWLLHHFDPDYAVLTSRVGPFARCALDRHVAAADRGPLPVGSTS